MYIFQYNQIILLTFNFPPFQETNSISTPKLVSEQCYWSWCYNGEAKTYKLKTWGLLIPSTWKLIINISIKMKNIAVNLKLKTSSSSYTLRMNKFRRVQSKKKIELFDQGVKGEVCQIRNESFVNLLWDSNVKKLHKHEKNNKRIVVLKMSSLE